MSAPTLSSPPTPSSLGVVLDAFGTIVYMDGPRLRPYRQVWQYLRTRNQLALGADPSLAMRLPLTLQQVCAHWQTPGSPAVPAEQWEEWEEQLAQELTLINLYPDVLDFMDKINQQGMSLAICSNLALPYAAKVVSLLEKSSIDAWVWSFEQQCIKPEPAIYQATERLLGLPPEQLLMVGDSSSCDVEGPRQQGWRSLLLDRSGLSYGALNLKEVLAIAYTSRLRKLPVK